ncbi:MAG: sulfotransferase [Desulfobacteraceae bacterium]|nr:sulfotransferase [Desulfobacteraceae bacterium]
MLYFFDFADNGFLFRLCRKAYRYKVTRSVICRFFSTRQPKKLVFLLGCYNSGTTITQRLIASHPSISTLPVEGAAYTSYLNEPGDLGWMRMWYNCREYVEKKDLKEPELAGKIMSDWSPWIPPGVDVLLEKSITHLLRIDWLHRNFPNSYFIGIHRNGYCVAEGILRRGKPKGLAADKMDAYPIELAGKQWAEANAILADAVDRLPRLLLFKYEDFVSGPVDILGKIYAFLDLSQPYMTSSEKGIVIEKAEFEMRNMNPASLSRLGKTDFEKLRAVPEFHAMMRRLGYEN